MPDRAHWLLELGDGDSLPRLVVRLKSASAREANRTAGRQGRLWQRAYHDRALRREDDVRSTARHLVGNPLRARLVESLGDYPYCDAIWL